MQIYLLFIALGIFTVGNGFSAKLCSNAVTVGSPSKYFVFLTVNSLIACAFFFVTGGFRVYIDSVTVTFALVYAAVVALSVCTTFVAYKMTSAAGVTLIASAVSLVATVGVGSVFFGESIGTKTALRIVIMLISVAMMLAGSPKRSIKKTAGLYITLIMMTLTSCANTVVLKLFAKTGSALSESSMFFLTNAFLIPISLLCFVLICARGGYKNALYVLKPRYLALFSSNTLCSNAVSLLQMALIVRIDLSVYTPISSAVTVVAGTVVSVICRERLSPLAYAATAVACACILIF